jgi:anti-sigma regulatory factor (Ser/Thr protein kinase)
MQLFGTARQRRHLIRDGSAIGEARRDSLRLAEAAGLSATAVGRVAIVATELANNLLRHAEHGELLLQSVQDDCVEVIAVDRGPGMGDVQGCLRDGYSSRGTPGTGLGAVRRLAAEFDIHSEPARGTAVMARIGGAKSERFGAICTAKDGELDCGDTWRLARARGKTSLAVIDGLGHGTQAAEAAQKAAGIFQNDPFLKPREQMTRMHQALHGTRGAAGACAHLEGKDFSYAGIGNISGRLCEPAGSSRGLVSHSGTLGVQTRRVQQFDYPQVGALLIMHSDGISARWDLNDRVELRSHHPALVAAVLYRDHSRGRDDATIVVIDV